MTHDDITPEQEEAERSKPTGRTKLTRLFVLVLVLLAWFGLAGVGGPLIGRLSEVQKNDNASFLPKTAESTEVGKLAAKFSSTDALPYFVVIERPTGLKPSDADAVKSFIAGIPSLPFEIKGYSLGPYLAAPPVAAVPSQDGKALLVPVLLNAKTAAEVIGDSSPLYEGAKALKASVASTLTPTGLAVYVAGPGGVLADFVTAFAGIDGILLLVALGVVFFILLVVYRSPILPITVLMTAVFGLAVAAMVIYPLAKNDIIGLNGQSQGILSILVVGAATDYSLLLVSRYREELHQHPSKWVAMGVAWRAAFSPIAASAATVILGLLCLLLSQLGSTRGLGPIGALGHCRCAGLGAHLPPGSSAALRAPHLLADHPQGRPRPRRGLGRASRHLGSRCRHGGSSPSAHLGVDAGGAARLRLVRPDPEGRRDHPVADLLEQGRVRHRPGGPGKALPRRLGLAGADHRAPSQGRTGIGRGEIRRRCRLGVRGGDTRVAAEGRGRQCPRPGDIDPCR